MCQQSDVEGVCDAVEDAWIVEGNRVRYITRGGAGGMH
jgi:hypothetical protein